MSTSEILALLIIVVVILVWRITWLASRVHRVTTRAERTWSALDAALVGRARRAAELVMMPGLDPATALAGPGRGRRRARAGLVTRRSGTSRE